MEEKRTTDVSPTGQAAERYRRRGWSVIPLRPGDKRPLIRWDMFQDAPPSAPSVANWFRQWPDANVGIVTGQISNLVVLDVDRAHEGEASLDRLERLHGSLPTTIEAITGGGGRHIYFEHPGRLVRNRAGLAQGIDLRGDGGYVVAPPSLHPNGRRYEWVSGRSPEDVSLAPLPRWIFVATRGARTGRRVAEWRQLVRGGVPEGQRNSTIASLTGHLLWHGVDPDVALELMLAWNRTRCRPPLDDDEVARVVQSITHLHEAEESAPRESVE